MSTLAAMPPVTTAEQLLDLPDDGWRYELVRGELRRAAPAGYRHGKVAARIAARIDVHVHTHALGDVLGAETGFRIGRAPDTVRAADVAFVAADRVPTDVEGFAELAPDLVVEVVSPGDRAAEAAEKVFAWLEAGCRAVWVAYPKLRRVVVHLPDGVARALGPDDRLEGGDALPGFSVTVRELFE